MHMATNGGNTEGLFRAGIMSSGSAVPTGDISDVQSTYDAVASAVGCLNASDSLGCLREIPAKSLLAAATELQNEGGFNVSSAKLRCASCRHAFDIWLDRSCTLTCPVRTACSSSFHLASWP